MAGGYPKPSGIEPERFDHVPARVPPSSLSSTAAPATTTVAPLPRWNAPGPRGMPNIEAVRECQVWLMSQVPRIAEPDRVRYQFAVTTLVEVLLSELEKGELRKLEDEVRKKLEEEKASLEKDKASFEKKRVALEALKLKHRIANSFSTQTDPAPSRISSATQTDVPESGTSGSIASATQTEQLPTSGFSSSTQTELPASGFSSTTQTDLPPSGFSSSIQTDLPQSGSSIAPATQTELPPSGFSSSTQTELPASGFSSTTQTDLPPSGFSSSTQTDLPPSGFSSSTQTELPPSGIASATQTGAEIWDDESESSIHQDSRFKHPGSDTDGIPTPPTTAAPTPSLAPVNSPNPVSTQLSQLSTECDITDAETGRIETQPISSPNLAQAQPAPTSPNQLSGESDTILGYPLSSPPNSTSSLINETALIPATPAPIIAEQTPKRTIRSNQPTAINSSREQTIQFGITTFAWDSDAERKPPANCLGLRPKQPEIDTQTISGELPQTDQGFIENNSTANHSSTSAGKENRPQTPSKRSSESPAPPKKRAKKKAAETENHLADLTKHLIDTNQHSTLGLPATAPPSEGTAPHLNSIQSAQTDQLFAEISATVGTSSASAGTVAPPSLTESTGFDQLFAEFCDTNSFSSASAGEDNQRNDNQPPNHFDELVVLGPQKDLDEPDAGIPKDKAKKMNPPAYESLLEVFDHGKYLDDNKVHILLAASGSVATIKIPVIIRELAKPSKTTPPISIRVIITDAAAGFLADQADEQPDYRHLESLKCVSGVYTNDDEWEVPWVRGNKILHIELRRWADIMVVAPLSANTLAKVVGGMSDNLLLSTMRAWDVFGNYDARHTVEFRGKKLFFGNRSPDLSKLLGGDDIVIKDDADAEKKGKNRDLAAQMEKVAIGESSDTKKKEAAKTYGRKRILVAPSMNPAMWDHPITKEHIDVLQTKWGVSTENGWIEVLGPIHKTVACGDSGTGAMMEATDIVKRVWEIVTPM
ncbi:hypothetical protein EG328_005420 [Venturia inaequalis]|uniref:Flavoprotein domain-containing protein n=1 Tax=Venturia inaequalis TaxID=5025 RepID=A0A8H3VCL2_VENIN|nr:hypothetical protein EG328_005420 [Venturia inaequalis]